MNITAKEIEKSSGLDYYYILKAVKEMPDVFDEIITRGSNNTVLFSSESAYTIFDKIKQLKSEGHSLKSIHLVFRDSFNQNIKSDNHASKNDDQNETVKLLLDKLESSNNKTIDALENLIKTKDNHIKTLESKVLLLTSGLSEEEALKQYQEKQEKLIRLEYELKSKDQDILHLQESESKSKELQEKLIELDNDVKYKDETINEIKNKLSEKELKSKEIQEKFIELSHDVKYKDETIFDIKNKLSEKDLKSKELQDKLIEMSNDVKYKDEAISDIKNKMSEQELKSKQTQEKLQVLTQELTKLEGKFFVSKRRKDLLAEINQLTLSSI